MYCFGRRPPDITLSSAHRVQRPTSRASRLNETKSSPSPVPERPSSWSGAIPMSAWRRGSGRNPAPPIAIRGSPYLTLLRRRWTRNASTMTKRTPATILIISVWFIPSSFQYYLVKRFLNASAMTIAAGPRVTRNKQGKINNTRGKMSLTVVFAAISSTC